jgi:hypothetical protein
MGVVNRVLPLEELLPYAQQQAAKLAALPAASIRVTKQLMKKNRVTATEQQMVAEIEHFSRMLTAPEAKEAFTAFFEKRKPDFTGFPEGGDGGLACRHFQLLFPEAITSTGSTRRSYGCRNTMRLANFRCRSRPPAGVPSVPGTAQGETILSK